MGLSIQEKKFKIDFQDGNCGAHLVFPVERILTIIDLQVNSMILNKFQVNWPFDSGEEAKNRFSKWPPMTFIFRFPKNWETYLLTLIVLKFYPLHFFKAVFPTKIFEIKLFILKFAKEHYFLPKN